MVGATAFAGGYRAHTVYAAMKAAGSPRVA